MRIKKETQDTPQDSQISHDLLFSRLRHQLLRLSLLTDTRLRHSSAAHTSVITDITVLKVYPEKSDSSLGSLRGEGARVDRTNCGGNVRPKSGSKPPGNVSVVGLLPVRADA